MCHAIGHAGATGHLLNPLNIDFSKYYIKHDDRDYTAEWLSIHMPLDYKRENITIIELQNVLNSMSDYEFSLQYKWIKCCMDYMVTM